MLSIFGSLALQMLIMQAVRLAVVFFFGSPCTIIGRRALLKGASATQSNKQKIEVVSLKQAFPGPEVWQVLFTIFTDIWCRMVAGSRRK